MNNYLLPLVILILPACEDPEPPVCESASNLCDESGNVILCESEWEEQDVDTCGREFCGTEMVQVFSQAGTTDCENGCRNGSCVKQTECPAGFHEAGGRCVEDPKYDDFSGHPAEFSVGSCWDSHTLKWCIEAPSNDLSTPELVQAGTQAAALWTRSSGLTLTHTSDCSEAEIRLSWHFGEHGDGFPFDGPNTTLAHAFPPHAALRGQIHFCEAEKWTTATRETAAQPIDVVTVAAHEFGHALGIGHSNVRMALMFDTYSGSVRALSADDIEAIQSCYGEPGNSDAPEGLAQASAATCESCPSGTGRSVHSEPCVDECQGPARTCCRRRSCTVPGQQRVETCGGCPVGYRAEGQGSSDPRCDDGCGCTPATCVFRVCIRD